MLKAECTKRSYPEKAMKTQCSKNVIEKYTMKRRFLIMRNLPKVLFLIWSLLLVEGNSATVLTVAGSGTGNVGYPTYSGTYVNVTISFILPTLAQNEYYTSGDMEINYSFPTGQQSSTGRSMSANINSQQLETWNISQGLNQTKTISLNSGTLLSFASSGGQTINTVVNLTMPTGFDRFTMRGWVTVDSSQLLLTSVPEPTILSLLNLASLSLFYKRRKK